MRYLLFKKYKLCRLLAIVVSVAILVLAILGNVNLVDSHHSTDHRCHHHTCWLLMQEVTLPCVIILAWFSLMFSFAMLREHVLLLFKPPRLCQYCGQNLGRLFGNNTIVAKGFVLRAGFFQTQPVS